jgi:tetratricopeptide (TPR) repeat protein
MKQTLSLIIAAALFSHASGQTQGQTPAQLAEAYYLKGLAAEKAGDPAAAKQAYTAALKANPNHANARYSIGQLKLNSVAIAAKGREAKFGAVIIPVFKLEDASLREALDALGTIIEKESKDEVAPNFIVEDPKQQLSAAKISLNLKAMPAKAVMKYVMDQAGAKARYDEHAIVIAPK